MNNVVEYDFWYPSPEYSSIIFSFSGRNDLNRSVSGGNGIYIDYSGDEVKFIENGIVYLSLKKDYKSQVFDACDCMNIALGMNFRRAKESLRRLVTNYIYGSGVTPTNTTV